MKVRAAQRDLESLPSEPSGEAQWAVRGEGRPRQISLCPWSRLVSGWPPLSPVGQGDREQDTDLISS